jgi:hypothetical protein
MKMKKRIERLGFIYKEKGFDRGSRCFLEDNENEGGFTAWRAGYYKDDWPVAKD